MSDFRPQLPTARCYYLLPKSARCHPKNRAEARRFAPRLKTKWRRPNACTT